MSNHCPFNIDGFETIRVLSDEGATGNVYLATAPNGLTCALKVLVKDPRNRKYAKLHSNMAIEICTL